MCVAAPCRATTIARAITPCDTTPFSLRRLTCTTTPSTPGNTGLLENIDELIHGAGLHIPGQPAHAENGHSSPTEANGEAVTLNAEFSSLVEMNKLKANGSTNGTDKAGKRPNLLLPGEDGSNRVISRKNLKNPLGGGGGALVSSDEEEEEVELSPADLVILKRHFQQADEDNSGEHIYDGCDQRERRLFTPLPSHPHSSRLGRSGDIDLREAFKLFDDIMLEGNHIPPPPHILHELFDDADADHGGSLDFEEFQQLYKKVKRNVKVSLVRLILIKV